MAKAEIDISLQGSDSSFGVPTYRPGDVVRGNFTLFPDENVKCNHLFVRLLWQTEGRGTRFREVVVEEDVYQGEFQAGLPRTFDFQFALPPDPWSYEGHYISVVWGVEVQLDVPWSRDPKQFAGLVMSPDRTITDDW